MTSTWWMLDGVDIVTDWTEQRAQENRSQHCTLAQIKDVKQSLPLLESIQTMAESS
jgi:hypothetical protein